MKLRTVIISLTTAALAAACGNSDRKQSQKSNPEETAVPIQQVGIELENGPGSEAFIANCQTCHTARYVLMQPKLSRKAWEKSVEKMIKVYGAEIDSMTANSIVNYLVARQH